MQINNDKYPAVSLAVVDTDNPDQTLESILAAVSSDCTQCGACVKQCAFLQRHGDPRQIALAHNPQKSDTRTHAFECSLCGLCKAVCPHKVDTPAMNLQLRRECVNRGEGTIPKHAPLMKHEQLGMSRRFTHYGLPSQCTTVFFPGCSFAGTRPHLVHKVLAVLQKKDPATGVVLDCCGKPSHDLGRQEYFAAVFGELRDYLVAQKIQTIVTACPHCHSMFTRYGAPLETVSVYELLNEQTHTGHKSATGITALPPVAVHDPCGIRFRPLVQSAVRSLVIARGRTIRESPHHGTRSICCGAGAGIPFTAADLSAHWTRRFAAEAQGRPLVTSCCGCLQKLGSLAAGMHVLDLYFASDPAAMVKRVKAARPPFTYLNRLLLKMKLRKDHRNAHRSERISAVVPKLPIDGALRILFVVACAVGNSMANGTSAGTDLPVVIDSAQSAITFRAIYRPTQFNYGTGLHNHHLMVWQRGKAAGNALFVALCADSAIHDALLLIGAVAGNNLSHEAWTKLDDPLSVEPDKSAKGSPLVLTIEKNAAIRPLTDAISDKNGNPFTLRFAGNRTHIRRWQSGCVVCLESCPGSKIANSMYTMRDLKKKKALFEVRTVQGLNDGDTVMVRISIE